MMSSFQLMYIKRQSIAPNFSKLIKAHRAITNFSFNVNYNNQNQNHDSFDKAIPNKIKHTATDGTIMAAELQTLHKISNKKRLLNYMIIKLCDVMTLTHC